MEKGGNNLKELLSDESFSIKARAQAYMDVAEGLRKMHERGVVHGDLKPANVVRRTDGKFVLMTQPMAALADGRFRSVPSARTLPFGQYLLWHKSRRAFIITLEPGTTSGASAARHLERSLERRH